MSTLTAIGLGLLIGAILGALGGAGSILAVPALVYLLGQSAQDATTSSLVIVGLTALVGVASHARSGNVHWRTGIALGVIGIIA
ncbi:MAG: TSUP family transporter, partial [Pseudonocardiaceae bacterium]